MKIQEFMKDFLLEVKMKHSLGTLKYYENHLFHFLNYAKSFNVNEVEEVTKEVLVDYIAHMKQTCANITINKNIGCLKMMYKSMNIKFDFLMSIEKLKVRQKTYDMIPEVLLKKIRAYVKELPDGVGNNLFYKCAVLLLMDTGARANEIMMIEKNNVDTMTNEILLTHTKTKEDRIVYISDPCAKELWKLMRIKTSHPFLLHNITKNRHGSYDDLVFFLKKLKKIFRQKKLHAHMFRHSMATIWLRNGTDIRSVMDVLGHKNLETTQRYLHAEKERTKRMYRENYKLDD